MDRKIVTLTEGVWDDAAQEVCTAGHCHSYALAALRLIPGAVAYGCVAGQDKWGDPLDPDELDPDRLLHVMIKLPEGHPRHGQMLDGYGDPTYIDHYDYDTGWSNYEIGDADALRAEIKADEGIWQVERSEDLLPWVRLHLQQLELIAPILSRTLPDLPTASGESSSIDH